eukprot:gb/GFBE01066040.1/.p1 GENE.gb/GFBE01066040.1/~~gb/GFBE01066040.1/.p1  ORF type:complete len:288 (+),score=46.45 gb/GFBE01066040.1/:1-864(+)
MGVMGDAVAKVSSAEATCSPEGDMLWSKGLDGSDHFSMCYAPATFGGGLGPTGGHMQCDAGSYFVEETPMFCCKKPRVDMNGTTVPAKGDELCVDTLAKFDEDSQEIKFTRGPQTTATKAQQDLLWSSGLGDTIPSPIGLKAVRPLAEDWHQVNKEACRGDLGTLINWKAKPGQPGRTELCPAGTPPVSGRGYMSFSCDGYAIKEERWHCCTVNGHLRCGRRLVDTSSMEKPCNCNQNELAESKKEALANGATGATVAESSTLGLALPPWALAGARRGRRPRTQGFL